MRRRHAAPKAAPFTVVEHRDTPESMPAESPTLTRVAAKASLTTADPRSHDSQSGRLLVAAAVALMLVGVLSMSLLRLLLQLTSRPRGA